MAWGVLSGVSEMAWDVLSGVANLCGMFCRSLIEVITESATHRIDWYQTSIRKILKYVRIHIEAYTPLKKITDCFTY